MSSRTVLRQHTAAGLGCVGAILGVVAGVTQSTIGSRIPSWTGDKNSPVVLGLVTVLLSLLALGAALMLRAPGPAAPGRRAAAAIAMLVPAGVCVSTVGRLWVVPGLLLVAAFVSTLAAGGIGALWPVVASHWTRGLVSLLGICEIVMAATAGPAVTIVVGVLGGAVLMSAPWLTFRGSRGVRPVLLLLIGTVPFALLTWWSLVSPLLGAIALLLGFTALRVRPVEGATGPGGPAPLPEHRVV